MGNAGGNVFDLARPAGAHGFAFAFGVVGKLVVGDRDQHVVGGMAVLGAHGARRHGDIFHAYLRRAKQVLLVNARGFAAGIAVVRALRPDLFGFALRLSEFNDDATKGLRAFILDGMSKAGVAKANRTLGNALIGGAVSEFRLPNRPAGYVDGKKVAIMLMHGRAFVGLQLEQGCVDVIVVKNFLALRHFGIGNRSRGLGGHDGAQQQDQDEGVFHRPKILFDKPPAAYLHCLCLVPDSEEVYAPTTASDSGLLNQVHAIS
jgi:hypothetical protein